MGMIRKRSRLVLIILHFGLGNLDAEVSEIILGFEFEAAIRMLSTKRPA